MKETETALPLEVWIDGDCALCRRSERWCSARDPGGRLRFRDLRQASADELPRPADAMLESVHLRLPDGEIATGFDAWRGILHELPGWRWLAAAAGLPLLRLFGPMIYTAVARNRRRLAKSEGPPLVNRRGRSERPVD